MSFLGHALLLELQRYMDTVRCVVLGVEVPRNPKEQLTQTLKTNLVFVHPKIRGWAPFGAPWIKLCCYDIDPTWS